MKKRLAALALGLVMLLTLLPTAALAAEGDFEIEDGVLIRYHGTADEVVVPAGVTEISNWAFFASTATKIVIPEGVTVIQDGYAQPDDNCGTFYGSGSLKELVLPESLTHIGSFAFWGCSSLTDITIPAAVQSMDGAFIAPVTIHGVPGSAAERYAAEMEYPFVPIDQTGAQPAAPVVEVPTAPTAYPSTQSVLVDGAPVEFQCYALKDAAGNDTNYIKLRDVASVLNGTAVQFNVGWDGAVNIETGKAYAPNGSEMSTPFSGERAYEPVAAETRIDGSPAALDAIVLKDDAGGAYTYYKLRDLGAALGFTVDWSAEKGIFIETK